MAENKNLEELFKDRYSEKDERYKTMADTGFEKVIVVHPWDPRRNNNYRNRGGFNSGGGRGDGGGGYRNQNRGGWAPRGGGYRGRGGGWQDRGGQRQPWRGGGNICISKMKSK
ncbi:hypothetical protein GCK72_001907 [Caenorhabditis remanei]|uniref:Uncharacterized protein n=1 Tax=Caenorhabditis remanei TaxID=31234 RepID=A0A6A5HQW6_CAERE|nr:hypothetical protein GCK72_001907 [Caenorhabditis remanei]KAF1770089.1 hypothetical protein GCK72_001907 [Caenorhabditis remanei]